MKFSHFFIQRPIFAGVLSALVFLLGLIAMWRLPISEYPEVVPPTVVVQATYPGANPKTIAETVAAPLEQAINGVEDSIYMVSQATSDGVLAMTITFKLGTDIDDAQVKVQNRVSQAMPKLPEEVRRLGVTTVKQSPDLTMVVHLHSLDGRYDEVYLRNYASLQVKDVLARIPGAGSVQLFGSGDYAMRVWLDPDKIASRGLTASDVVGAIREQNVQIAAGAVGQQPLKSPVGFELQINAKGRLRTEEEFGGIIVKAGPNGEKTLLRDLARIELGAAGYSLRSLLNNQPAVAIPIFQSPGANALDLSAQVRATMEELKKDFPQGMEYSIVYDPTQFVRHSIKAVVTTLFEAVLLVVIVVILFLQTWRASIIPLAAVPVSLVGTFAVMLALGFSINMLTLFGLVLAIGIVVDDAIVVVENVERNISLGLSPFEATKKAMDEVTGPIIAIALVLCAVFIPTAFISGLTGQFYKQFAITIAISTVISAFNSLTLSPALSAVLLRSHSSKPDVLSRWMERLFGWFFRPFNRAFAWAGDRYGAAVGGVLRKSAIALILYAGLVGLTGWSFTKVPTGFVPVQDKQYLVAFAQLPDGASLDRTEKVIRQMADISMKHPGVENSVQFPGLSISGFSVSPNAGIVFVCLKPFEQRKSTDLSGPAIAAALNAQFSEIQEAFVLTVMPPPVNGLGMMDGFKLYLEDRAGLGYDELFKTMQGVIGQGYQTPALAGVFSTFTVNVPQIDAEIDRVKAKSQGVPLQNLFETMQVYLGSLYVNDFNLFGRTYQVVAQADARFRDRLDDITRLKTRNAQGQMVPVGSLVKTVESYGPDRALRYNGYPAAEINGSPAPNFSSGQAEAAMAGLVGQSLPKGMAFEWTDLTYQRILAGNTAIYVYPLCILLVFLVLAAQYESFRLPLAIILVVPLCLLFAMAGVYFSRGDNNIFTQIGLIVLVGLACKNAILIVEFAQQKQNEGMSPVEAAIEACRLRLRPILMTSIAFIAGVFPLVISTGAGAEMRRAMGVAVFAGMIGVTLFGLFLTPVFYVVLMKLGWRQPAPRPTPSSAPGHGSGGAPLLPGASVAGLAVLLAAGSMLFPTKLGAANEQWAIGNTEHSTFNVGSSSEDSNTEHSTSNVQRPTAFGVGSSTFNVGSSSEDSNTEHSTFNVQRPTAFGVGSSTFNVGSSSEDSNTEHSTFNVQRPTAFGVGSSTFNVGSSSPDSNTERSTSNVQRPMPFEVGSSTFNIRSSFPILLAGFGSLKVGPDYRKPTNAVPAEFRDTPAWKEANPSDAQPKGPWWAVFNDPVLNSLMDRATASNQTLRAALARFDQARATARIDRSRLVPSVDFNPEATRERYSPNQEPSFGAILATTIKTPLDLSYEIDLWGKVRRSFESARAEAQASANDLQNVLLSVQADLARNYFELRSLDRQQEIVRLSIKLRKEAIAILQARVEAGTAPELDSARAETEVANAEIDLVRLERARNSFEIALSILTGTSAPVFSVQALTASQAPSVPAVPPALPSQLLERRPDVATAERQLAAANARIGVAKGAFFPVVRLTGSAGYISGELESLFNWDSRVWSIGPSVSLPIFAGGRNRASLARARSVYDESMAQYRQRVLIAFAEVQECLTALKLLATESEAVGRAQTAAHRTFDFAKARYEGGIISYLEVIESQRTLLAAELDDARLLGQRQIATVLLIKALGGGWTTTPETSR